jgi:hypothetical protein
LTCDAWQAGNQDAYFAVTGHWSETMPNGDWEEHSALFGFTQLNSSHDGVRLGRALFKIVKRLAIGHKVCVPSRFYSPLINGDNRLGGLPATMPRITSRCCKILGRPSIDRGCEGIAKRNGTGNLIISGALLIFDCFSRSKPIMIHALPMSLTWQRKHWFRLTASQSTSIQSFQMTTNRTWMPFRETRLALYVLLLWRLVVGSFSMFIKI